MSLDGLQQVPGVTSTATGYGYALYENTGFSETLWYRIFLSGLDYSLILPASGPFPADINDDVTGIHFHSGARGANGNVVFNILNEDPDDLNLSESGGVLLIEGQWEALDPASLPLDFFSVQLGNAIVGNDAELYVNVHTTGNPAGEIRGQFVTLSDEEANTITGTPELDYLYGLGGDDTLEGLAGPDLLDGGEGSDTASYASSGQEVSINLADGTATGGDAQGDVLVSIENLIGTSRTDSLFGDDNGNVLEGGDGADDIQGGGGSDTASYASSDAGVTINLETEETTGGDATGDTLVSIENLTGSAFADDLTGDDTPNRLEGLDQNDTLTGLGGADTLLGGDGVDTADYSASPDAISVDLEAGNATGGDAEGDSLSGIENLQGSGFADNLRGNADANLINGFGGDDTIEGGGGADTLDGGTGTNTVSYGSSAAGVTVSLLDDLAAGGDAAGDELRNFVNIVGSLFADNLTGNAQDNRLRGDEGNDVLDGGEGIDTAVFSGLFEDAEVTFEAEHVVVTSADGIDTLNGIERLQFDDQTVSTLELTPVPTVSITGTATQRETLTALPANTSAIDGSTISYQWLRNGTDVSGATASTYELTQEDVGQPVSVRMSYIDAGGPQTVSSTPTAAVVNVNDEPVGDLIFSGDNVVGQTLFALTDGISDADGLGAFSFQWLRDGVPIAGATEDNYTPRLADFGRTVSATASYTDGHGTLETVESERLPIFFGGSEIVVTTTADVIDPDDGETSLREAILQANADPDPDVIRLGADTYYLNLTEIFGPGELLSRDYFDDIQIRLASALTEENARLGDLDILSDVAIVGAQGGTSVVRTTMAERAFHVHDGAEVSFSGFRLDGGVTTVASGDRGAAADGGGLLNTGGDITIHDMEFTQLRMHNATRGDGRGGNKKHSYYAAYQSKGGAVFNESGTIDISDSLFQDNLAGRGGAIFAAGGDISVFGTRFEGNQVYQYALSDIEVIKGTVTPNYVASNNTGVAKGTAIYSSADAQINIHATHDGSPAGSAETEFFGNSVDRTVLPSGANAGDGTLMTGNIYLDPDIDVTSKGNTPETLEGVTRDAPLTRDTLASSLVASAVAAATTGDAVLTRLAGLDLTATDLFGSDFLLADSPFFSRSATEIVLQLGGARLVIGGTGLALPDDLFTPTREDLLAAAQGTVTSLALTNTDGSEVLATLTGLDQGLGELVEIATEVYDPTTPPTIEVITGAPVSTVESETPLDLPGSGVNLTGTPGPDVLIGIAGDDTILGLDGNDRLIGDTGNDSLDGGLGADTLNGGDGDDTIIGGPGADDLRDIVYAGEGNDSVDAGAGNDLVYGQGGNDTIAGGFGVDEIQGQDGDDVITGSAFSDLVFGGAGNDFVNGGFGHDRINGGSGADKFFHVGVEGHGSDWVQDYSATEGDVLLFGNASATRDQFQVNFNHTASAEGERAGDDAVQEAFVIYRPTGQIMWALVDGQGQSSINLQIGSEVFDLLV
ncbi:CHRD domain-containing protein [Ruegeria aquimaris]|uniref:CHRD domain-containing protein n=1 Tax=Ruegeria aquimaris TaxID=2984333 RepID=A0ABT3ARV8_9RHOB|nr:CHRD domain-containing protein [Ruegeria sp. XHP0148]MCV2891401.1 CHRD domain-containing protein [Ruegeria sp. XHP0148]